MHTLFSFQCAKSVINFLRKYSLIIRCYHSSFRTVSPSTFRNIHSNTGHKGKFYTTRNQKAPFPPNSFFKVPNQDIYVACPELTFMQAARHLSFHALVKLGFDLCAQYYPDEKETFSQATRAVLTTPEQLIAYAKSTNHAHGSAKAISAARYVLDSSNSPMETNIAAIFGLSISRFGFGLGGHVMNGGVELTEEGRALMGVGELRGDIVWHKEKVVVEYNSKAAHNNDKAFYNDVNRSTAFKLAGYTCIGVTPDNIKNFESMENLASMVREALGRPAKKELLSAYEHERRAVYEDLFNSHPSGPIKKERKKPKTTRHYFGSLSSRRIKNFRRGR